MPKTSISDFHKQIQISPGFPLPYCVPKINFTFYVLNEMQKNLPNRQSALSLSLCLFLEGRRGHLKYFRLQREWEHPTKCLMKRESSQTATHQIPPAPSCTFKNERSLRTCCCYLYYVTEKKGCGVNLWNLFVQGQEKGY